MICMRNKSKGIGGRGEREMDRRIERKGREEEWKRRGERKKGEERKKAKEWQFTGGLITLE